MSDTIRSASRFYLVQPITNLNQEGDLPSIRLILQSNRSLLTEKLFGYEGHDVYGIVPNVSDCFLPFELSRQSKSKRCYSFTGIEKVVINSILFDLLQDGYFYPLHVAAEMGHKALIILLVQVSK
jgi:hypothetical protein